MFLIINDLDVIQCKHISVSKGLDTIAIVSASRELKEIIASKKYHAIQCFNDSYKYIGVGEFASCSGNFFVFRGDIEVHEMLEHVVVDID